MTLLCLPFVTMVSYACVTGMGGCVVPALIRAMEHLCPLVMESLSDLMDAVTRHVCMRHVHASIAHVVNAFHCAAV